VRALLPALVVASWALGYASAAIAAAPELVVPRGHSDNVELLQYSPDGRFVLSGGRDRTLKLWDAATQRELRTFTGHTTWVDALAFSPDGRTAVSAAGAELRVWNVADATTKLALERAHDGSVDAVTFSPSGALVASAGPLTKPKGSKVPAGTFSYSVRVWDAQTGALVRSIELDQAVTQLVWARDDELIAVTTGALLTMSPLTGARLRTRPLARSGRLAADLRTVIADGFDLAKDEAVVWILDGDTNQVLRELRGHRASIKAVAIHPGGRQLLTGADDAKIILRDMETGRVLRQYEARSNVGGLAFSPDGARFVSAHSDRTVRLWETESGREIARLGGLAGAIHAIAASADGARIAFGVGLLAANPVSSIRVFDVKRGKQILSLPQGASQLVFSPDGRALLCRGAGGAQAFDADKGALLWRVPGGFYSMALAPDGRELALAAESSITIVDTATGATSRSFPAEKASSLAWSPAGDVLFLGMSRGEEVRQVSAADGRTLRALKVRKDSSDVGSITALAVAADGKAFWSGTEFGSLSLWKKGAARPAFTVEVNVGRMNAVVVVPRGLVTASGGVVPYDPRVQLVDPSTGRVKKTLSTHAHSVVSAAALGDGRVVVTSSMDRTLRFIDVDHGVELASLVAFGADDWAVVAPDGRFDGSAEGLKQMYWVQGETQLPLDAFFENWAAPNLLARVLDPHARESSPAPRLDQGFQLPPVVKVQSPAADSAVAAEEIDVTVEATDQGGGIDEIRLFLNGKLVRGDTRGFKRAAAAVSSRTHASVFRVALAPGANELRAVALSAARVESAPHVLTVQRRAATAGATLHILAVGVDAYRNPRYRLNYGRADARALADRLAARAGSAFKAVRRLELYDENVTRDAVLGAFARVAQEARPEDVFVFFFAGHGVMSEGSEAAPSEFHLVMHDVTQLYGDDAGLAAKAISAAELRELATHIRAQKQLHLLDACQAGGAVATFAMRGAAEEKAILQLARSAGVMVLAATGSEQLATELKDLGHGVFTYALLAGLDGAADGGARDGKITVSELKAYLEDKVPELTRKFRGTAQYPNGFARGQDFPVALAK
jgi:WD40 repeat protein/uncharacterized caspase-like protein